MNKEIKEKWVAALRSGEYEQTKGYLKTDEGFCCLGVLCDVVKEDVGQEWTIGDDRHWGFYDETPTGESWDIVTLPKKIMDYVGLGSDNPEVVWPSLDKKVVENFLASLNDRGLSFSEIANIIEEQL